MGSESIDSELEILELEVTSGQVHASYSLPEWQAVKLTFSSPW